MTYRKYKVVDDWYRYGKSRFASYKGPCGIKFYGGLHGERRPWSRKYSNLSSKQKDFLAHGAFNIVNPQWKTINKYFFLKQASAFPKAVRIYLYDINRISELHEHSLGNSEKKLASAFVKLVVTLIFGRTDTLLFLYGREERRIYRVFLNEELLRKKYSRRILKKIECLRKWPVISPSIDGGSHCSNFITVFKISEKISSPGDAVKAAYYSAEIVEKGLAKKPRSSGALRMFLDPCISAACNSVIKWFVMNNDPRTNVSALKESISGANSTEQLMSTFFYIAHEGVSNHLKYYLKKQLGFCAVNGMRGRPSTSPGVRQAKSVHSLRAIINVQWSIDNYCSSF